MDEYLSEEMSRVDDMDMEVEPWDMDTYVGEEVEDYDNGPDEGLREGFDEPGDA